MVCKVCGKISEKEDANFCYYCGASFREGVDTSFLMKEEEKTNVEKDEKNQGDYANENSRFGPFANPFANNATRTSEISFGKWIIVMILPFIPVVGIWVFLILLVVLGFGKRTSLTMKNWARAMLVFGIILFVISSVYMTRLLADPAFSSLFEGLMP